MADQSDDTDLAARRMNRADIVSSAVFIVLGLTIVYFSWTMPRLEIRGVHPATVPGLVPGMLGAALALCGLALGGKALKESGLRGGWGDVLALLKTDEALRFAAVAAMTLVYSLILVGTLPFWLATALFVFVFIAAFEVWITDTPKPLVRALIWAAVQAVIVAVVVTLVFERGFLVRLP